MDSIILSQWEIKKGWKVKMTTWPPGGLKYILIS